MTGKDTYMQANIHAERQGDTHTYIQHMQVGRQRNRETEINRVSRSVRQRKRDTCIHTYVHPSTHPSIHTYRQPLTYNKGQHRTGQGRAGQGRTGLGRAVQGRAGAGQGQT